MKRFIVFLLVSFCAWNMITQRACSKPVVTISTFNIRMFPENATNRDRVKQLLVELDSDLIAVQEIRDEDALIELLRQASKDSGVRQFHLALSSCGGTGNIMTGLIYDSNKLTLQGVKQYREHRFEDIGDCKKSRMRAALLGIFKDTKGETLLALSVHMQHGPNPEQLEMRKMQWANVVKILNEAQKQFGGRAIALGDFNSTGFSDNAGNERDFIFKTTSDAGLNLATKDIACTSYWQPKGSEGDFAASILDHMVVGKGNWSVPEPQGMCKKLACQNTPSSKPPPDYHNVSDHCPIRITVE
jgi:endonuclease/exonuclease/phosphatase family metal-dependent hydrolase